MKKPDEPGKPDLSCIINRFMLNERKWCERKGMKEREISEQSVRA